MRVENVTSAENQTEKRGNRYILSLCTCRMLGASVREREREISGKVLGDV
jgi:hypothetical protein